MNKTFNLASYVTRYMELSTCMHRLTYIYKPFGACDAVAIAVVHIHVDCGEYDFIVAP